jgi:hypothetical protein
VELVNYNCGKMGLGKAAELIVNECVPVARWEANDKHDMS